MLLLIELSRLRIESFFCPSILFLPYHGQLGRNPCDGSRVAGARKGLPLALVVVVGTHTALASSSIDAARSSSIEVFQYE